MFVATLLNNRHEIEHSENKIKMHIENEVKPGVLKSSIQ